MARQITARCRAIGVSLDFVLPDFVEDTFPDLAAFLLNTCGGHIRL